MMFNLSLALHFVPSFPGAVVALVFTLSRTRTLKARKNQIEIELKGS